MARTAGMVAPAATAAPTPSAAATNVTDPSLIRAGDTYYLFSSGPGIELRESTDLIDWKRVGSVFPCIPAWALAMVPGATSVWAPDISYFDGAYHLYYAVSTFGSQRSVIGLATSPTLDPSAPGYGWVDHGLVVASQPRRDHFNAIDPNVLVDPASNVWLAFGSQWSGIKLVPLDPTTGKPWPSRGPVALAARPAGQPIEAPFLFHRGDFYYLFVSFDNCCQGAASSYKIMVGRSTRVTGPFLDESGRLMTRGGGSLVLAGSGRFRGPGSNAVIDSGGQTWLVYQAYDALNAGIPTLQVRSLDWTASGWPVAGAALS
jgi:arabinan endo-1,5-alpha-L-arabinosidase